WGGRAAGGGVVRGVVGRDQAAVGRAGGPRAGIVPLGAVGSAAHALGRARLPVVDEHVGRAVRIAGDEIGPGAAERDEATVGREGGPRTETVPLDPAGGDAHALGRARLPVVDEHVGRAVRVAGDEVGRSAVERDEAGTGGEGGAEGEAAAVAVSVRPTGWDARPLLCARLP